MLDPRDEICYASRQVMATRMFPLHHEQHASRAARDWSQFAIGAGRAQRKYHLMVARCAAVMGSACAGCYPQESKPLKLPTRMCLHSASARGE